MQFVLVYNYGKPEYKKLLWPAIVNLRQILTPGADYAYIHVTFGPLVAFVRLWIECIIVRPCTGAIQSLTFALYIIKPLFPDCEPPESALRLLAASKEKFTVFNCE